MENSPFDKTEKPQNPERKDGEKISRRSLLKGIASLGATKALSALDGEKNAAYGGALREEERERKDFAERVDAEVKKAAKLIEGGIADFF